MDLAKIGQFIKDCRKDKKLTQLQLSIEIGVSEKTISKWECGNGFPDATLMLPLCNALGVTANELLSGKRLKTDKEYKLDAEKNIVALKKNQEKSAKFVLNLEIVIGILSVSLLFTLVGIASYVEMPTYLRIILIAVGFIQFLPIAHLLIIIEKDVGYYECEHCHHKHIPTMKQMYTTMHMGRTRYMVCPECKKKSWQKKVISKD